MVAVEGTGGTGVSGGEELGGLRWSGVWQGLRGEERRPGPRVVQAVRVLGIVTATCCFVVAAGLYTRAGWAVAFWPWPDVRMSFIFLASIAAAIATPVLWIALTGELAALAGGALNLAVSSAGTAGYLLIRILRDGDRDLGWTTTSLAVFAVANTVLFWWSRAIPVRDPRPTPPVVRGALLVFALTLITVGSALVVQVDRIFPWDLSPRTSTVFGWIFLGASTYFLYGVARPRWAFAAGTLWSFLVYDLVLLSPYITLLGETSDPATGYDPYGYGVTTGGGNGVNETSLTGYLIVLSVSALLALWVFAVRRETRVWRSR